MLLIIIITALLENGHKKTPTILFVGVRIYS